MQQTHLTFGANNPKSIVSGFPRLVHIWHHDLPRILPVLQWLTEILQYLPSWTRPCSCKYFKATSCFCVFFPLKFSCIILLSIEKFCKCLFVHGSIHHVHQVFNVLVRRTSLNTLEYDCVHTLHTLKLLITSLILIHGTKNCIGR
jgi:hypothetical protein